MVHAKGKEGVPSAFICKVSQCFSCGVSRNVNKSTSNLSKESCLTKAPVLHSVLQAACGNIKPYTYASVIMAAAVVFKARNKEMCYIQSLIGANLYTGHASKAVSNQLSYAHSNCHIYSGIWKVESVRSFCDSLYHNEDSEALC